MLTVSFTQFLQLGRLVETENIQIPWSNISKRMGKRSRLSCFKKWQKMTGIFGGPPEKRAKTEAHQTAGAAAAAAMAAVTTNSVAELAAETVEALELPDAGHHNVYVHTGQPVYEEETEKV